jgi:hypothetical protein
MSNDLVPFPQLDNVFDYNPDLVDLSKCERKILDYWLTLLETNMSSLTDLALRGPKDDTSQDLKQRVDAFRVIFKQHLCRLREEPSAYGVLSIRSLLSLREQCLHEVGLNDIFADIKSSENEMAIKALPLLLETIDSADDSQKLDLLLDGILAGSDRLVGPAFQTL